LVGFARRLGTLIQNPKINPEDVIEDAELLMSFMTSKPIAQSLSWETTATFENDERPDIYDSSRPSMGLDQNQENPEFSFSCSGLSLLPSKPSESLTDNIPLSPIQTHRKSLKSTKLQRVLKRKVPSVVPSILFQRPIRARDKYSIGDAAKLLASNIMQSFETALAWRTESWVHSLASFIALKEKIQKQEGSAKLQDMEEYAKVMLQSREGRVIVSLLRGSSQVRIREVRTSFRITHQRVVLDSPESPPPTKKRRYSPTAVNCIEETNKVYSYQVGYHCNFQTVLEMSDANSQFQVVLEAPGIIQGTFQSAGPGDEEFTGVKIEINTDALAKSIEQSSRAVVRIAAECCLPTIISEESTLTPSSDTTVEETELITQSTPSPTKETFLAQRTTSTVVTPRRPTRDENDDHQQVVVYSDDESPRRVSPGPGSPKTGNLLATPMSPKPGKLCVPMLVSPPPSNRSYHEFRAPSALPSASANASSHRAPIAPRKTIDNGPFPALVEVACSVMSEQTRNNFSTG